MPDQPGSIEDWEEFDRARFLFYSIREFVATRCKRLLRTQLNPLCREILKYRTDHPGVEGLRAFMHVGHHPGVLCVWMPEARKLHLAFLVGLYLHEFGHLGSRGGEAAADEWVRKKCGISIEYRGRFELEWVSREDAAKALSVRPVWRRRRR